MPAHSHEHDLPLRVANRASGRSGYCRFQSHRSQDRARRRQAWPRQLSLRAKREMLLVGAMRHHRRWKYPATRLKLGPRLRIPRMESSGTTGYLSRAFAGTTAATDGRGLLVTKERSPSDSGSRAQSSRMSLCSSILRWSTRQGESSVMRTRALVCRRSRFCSRSLHRGRARHALSPVGPSGRMGVTASRRYHVKSRDAEYDWSVRSSP
jgi:hypothetical protein